MNLGLRHAALPAKNLQRASDFYRQALGFVPYHASDRDWAMVCRGGTTLSFIKVPEKAPDLPPPTAGTHPAHVGFTLSSRQEVDELHRRVQGLARAVGKVEEHRDGSYGFYLLDTEGNQLECIFIPHATMEQREKITRGVILFAHGSSDPSWRATFERFLALFRSHAPGIPTELAYMEFAQPDLSVAVSALARCTELHVIPIFLSSGGHVSRDIPALVQQVAQRHPSIHFETHPALGDDALVQDALVAAALQQLPGSQTS